MKRNLLVLTTLVLVFALTASIVFASITLPPNDKGNNPPVSPVPPVVEPCRHHGCPPILNVPPPLDLTPVIVAPRPVVDTPSSKPNGHKILVDVTCSATCFSEGEVRRVSNSGALPLTKFTFGETACYSTVEEAYQAATNTLEPYLINKCREKIEDICSRKMYPYIIRGFESKVLRRTPLSCDLPDESYDTQQTQN